MSDVALARLAVMDVYTDNYDSNVANGKIDIVSYGLLISVENSCYSYITLDLITGKSLGKKYIT